MEMLFFLDAPRFRRKHHFCCKVSSIRKLVLLLEMVRRWRCLWNSERMILTGENQSRRRISISYRYTLFSNRVQNRAAAVRGRRQNSQSVRHHYIERLVDTAQRNGCCIGNDSRTVHSHPSRFMGLSSKIPTMSENPRINARHSKQYFSIFQCFSL
jgi:hypothetical protein